MFGLSDVEKVMIQEFYLFEKYLIPNATAGDLAERYEVHLNRLKERMEMESIHMFKWNDISVFHVQSPKPVKEGINCISIENEAFALYENKAYKVTLYYSKIPFESEHGMDYSYNPENPGEVFLDEGHVELTLDNMKSAKVCEKL